MNTLNKFRNYGTLAILFAALTITSCSDDDDDNVTPVPPVENDEEVITDVKLVFTNTTNASDKVEARAQDPDGEGVQELMVLDTIRLDTSKTYELTFEIFNNLETPGENIGEEIEGEDFEHQIFFSFSNDAFANPAGNGNVDNASDPLRYNDTDSLNNPVGLKTLWTTSATSLTNGNFNVRLQHQPDGIKTSTSTANDGDTDFDLTFVMDIK